jgi:hypothetical protein
MRKSSDSLKKRSDHVNEDIDAEDDDDDVGEELQGDKDEHVSGSDPRYKKKVEGGMRKYIEAKKTECRDIESNDYFNNPRRITGP